MGMFGWSLPPGCSMRDIDEYAGAYSGAGGRIRNPRKRAQHEARARIVVARQPAKRWNEYAPNPYHSYYLFLRKVYEMTASQAWEAGYTKPLRGQHGMET